MPADGEWTEKAALQRHLKLFVGAPKISLSLESILDACVWRMDSKGGTSKTPKDT